VSKSVQVLAQVGLIAVVFAIWRRTLRKYSLKGDSRRRNTNPPPEGCEIVSLSRGDCNFRIDGRSNGGRLVVLVHGFAGCHLDLFPLAKELVEKQGQRVLRFDLFGRGWSSAPFHPCTEIIPELFAGQLAELLFHLQETEIDLLGYSMGGGIAACFASRFGKERVASLTFVAPAGLSSMSKIIPPFLQGFLDVLTDMPGGRRLGSWLMQKRLRKLENEDLMHWTVEKEANRELVDWFHTYQRQRLQDEPGLPETMIETMKTYPWTHLTPFFEAASRAEIPTLAFFADKDQLVPIECAAELKNCFRTSPSLYREEIITNGGHMLPIERAPFVAQAMQTFFHSIP